MIRVGLAGWGDHGQLYGPGIKANERLKTYSKHFPAVEVDSSFYAIPKPEQFQKWSADTPADFGFVVKAYQGLTGHLRGPSPYGDEEAMLAAMVEAVSPIRRSGQFTAVLFQYPPWFSCTKANVDVLRRVKEKLGDLPAALEFRHRSWFSEGMTEKTLAFMEREGWIHSICDEPDAGEGSIPAVLQPTDRQLTIVRFHGRNKDAWNGEGRADWRAVRYLYRYSREELEEWKERLIALEQRCEKIVAIFNNNSGGDAADNAKELMQLLGQTTTENPPEQLEWF